MKMVYLTAVSVYTLMCAVTSSAACLKDLFLFTEDITLGFKEGVRV